MKKFRLFSCIAAACALGFAACNNESDTTGTGDSTGNNNITSTNKYAARADSFRANSAAGYYLNPRTGKPYKSLTLDTATGSLTDEMSMPVKRYVDNRNWRVYDAMTFDSIGSSRMDKDMLMYDKQGEWIPYDKMWTDDTSSTNMNNSNMNTGDDQMDTSSMGSGSGGKTKIKIKTPEGKIKMDEDGTKVKPKQ